MLLPGGDDNVGPVRGEARMCAGEDTVCECGGVERCQKGGDVRTGEQEVQGGVQAVTGGGGVADLGEGRGEEVGGDAARQARGRYTRRGDALTGDVNDAGDVGILRGENGCGSGGHC